MRDRYCYVYQLLLAGFVVLTGGRPLVAQCRGFLAENTPPPVVRGMSASDAGFTVRYWAWDDLNRRRGGSSQPLVVDTTLGLQLSRLDWTNAEVCQEAGPVPRTAVLFEALGSDGHGRWALINLAAEEGGDLDIDLRQRRLGQLSSLAVPVPRPRIDAILVGQEAVQVRLGWTLDGRGETLSDLTGKELRPLRSVRGYAVYVITGLVATPRPWDWSFGRDTDCDAVNGFSTDTSATLYLPRSMWSGVTVAFAVALTFDGDGDAEGESEHSRSVHGSYLGAPSPWLALPAIGYDVPVALVAVDLKLNGPSRLYLGFEGQAEPAGAAYRVWIHAADGGRSLLSTIAGGGGRYDLELELPPWCGGLRWYLSIEMLDAQQRTIDTARIAPDP